ncbi:MAG: Hsp33 family molecular chaperone HslO [Acholeplasmataceae bacterium]
MHDYALIASAYDDTVRIYVSRTTDLVERARQIHRTWPTATAAFGRFLTVSAMMGLMYKKGESLTLRIKGDGPIGFMLVEATPKGEVRGEINNPAVYLKYEDENKKHKLDVGKAVGKGMLHVTKNLGMKDFFSSSSDLQTGEIGDDFTYYFAVSEQVPSSVGLGVLVDTDQSVLASGGYIIQLMPDAKEETIERLEAIIATIPPISSLIEAGRTPEKILEILAPDGAKILARKPLAYACHCSKEGFRKSLAALDPETLRSLIEEDGKADITCHFCHEHYHFTRDELIEIERSKK